MADDPSQEIVDECVGNAHGNLARVRELVELHPSLVRMSARWGETSIQAATQMGNRPLIDYLVEKGSPVDFFTACVVGRVEQVRQELSADPARARARGVHDLAPLYFAAIGGQREAAEVLLAAGAGVDERAEAAAPIHGAVMGGSAELIRWLLEHGADPEAPDFKGRGARQLALDMNRADLAALFD